MVTLKETLPFPFNAIVTIILPFSVSPSGSVSVSPINFNAERNSVVSFTCVAQGGPSNMFNWTRLSNGEVLTNTSILSFTVSDGSQGGNYRCDVQNDAGSDSSTVILNGRIHI